MRMTHTDPGWLILTQNDSLWVSTPCDCISNLEYQGSAPVPGGLGYMYIRRHLLGLLPRLIHLLSNPSTFHLIIPNLISEYFRVFGFSLIEPAYSGKATGRKHLVLIHWAEGEVLWCAYECWAEGEPTYSGKATGRKLVYKEGHLGASRTRGKHMDAMWCHVCYAFERDLKLRA